MSNSVNSITTSQLETISRGGDAAKITSVQCDIADFNHSL
jgi:hypothetical protein